MKKIINIIILLSILFNLKTLLDHYNSPSNKLGKLRQDINVECLFIESTSCAKVNFILPKGMIVVDASPQGIASAGLFEPNRISFTIIVPEDSVEYSHSTELSATDSLYKIRDNR